MSELMRKDEAYSTWVQELKKRYRRGQIKASVAVNAEVQRFYWQLGRDIVAMDAENVYGSRFYSSLSRDLIHEVPDAQGFSPANLRYMRRFYELFPVEGAIVPQVAEQSTAKVSPIGEELFSIPWGHIRLLIEKCKGDTSKALFYARKTLENNWSRAMLGNFIGTNLYERQGKAVSNFAATLPASQGDLAQEITRDPYNFDFLAIRERYDERELKDALMDNITKFLLELGTGFASVGREYRVQIGQGEQWIDMLFYHIRLRCYVVLEVKVCDFEPAFMGQLGTYVVAVNHQLKSNEDNPTIGLLVCKSLDKVEAQYALESTSQPIGVSGYELSKLIPEDFKGSLPTIEEIEAELGGAQ
ncbi:MAG: DUF1016 domain-containing protein [Coriobacteriaceae bacterium]|nr:DUF1016 domain-containing protein [Coriobacteriaceae bacterium]